MRLPPLEHVHNHSAHDIPRESSAKHPRHLPQCPRDQQKHNDKITNLYNQRNTPSKDKDSGITNDTNLYATETMQNHKYPLELLLGVTTVSLETNRIVSELPTLQID